MKLLFDQNLSPRLVARLADLYPASAFAGREGFTIVTKDADFSDLCLLRGFPPKVVWIRRGNCTTDAIEQILRHHHDDIRNLEADGATGVLALF